MKKKIIKPLFEIVTITEDEIIVTSSFNDNPWAGEEEDDW